MDKVKLEPRDTPLGRFQRERTEAISEMFDNPDEFGIYPTTKFFARLDNCAVPQLSCGGKQSKMKKRYLGTIKDGAPVKVYADIEPYSIRLHCCDCGLTHDITIETKDGHLIFRFKQNQRSTAYHRRRLK